MRRIVLMVARLFLKAPYYLLRILWFSKSSKKTYEESFFYIKKVTKAAKAMGLKIFRKRKGLYFSPIIRECLMCWFFWIHRRFPLHLS